MNTNINLRKALEKAQKEGRYKQGSDQHKALTFYQLALDTSYLNQQGSAPLKPVLSKIRKMQHLKLYT